MMTAIFIQTDLQGEPDPSIGRLAGKFGCSTEYMFSLLILVSSLHLFILELDLFLFGKL
jgi:hypothetical protein